MATGLSVAKNLIEYNSNNLDENDGKEKEPIDFEFTDEKTGHEIMKMQLTLDDWIYKKKKRGRYYFD